MGALGLVIAQIRWCGKFLVDSRGFGLDYIVIIECIILACS
jgi:hypothetical protein